MHSVDRENLQDAPEQPFSGLNELAVFSWHLYDQTLGGLIQRPGLGILREFNDTLLKSFDAWINVQRASFPYQLLLLDIGLKSLESYLQRLMFSREISDWDWRQLLQLWSRVFDQTFAETFHSPEALQTQGTFLNAILRLQRQQQQLVEVFLKANHLPRRSEIDALHRSMYELRQELKQLKQENSTLWTPNN